MIKVHSINTIISDPDIKNGQPIVVDTQIRVVDVVASFVYRGLTPEELAASYNLTMAQIYAVLAYYYDHKSEIDEWFRQDAEEAEVLLKELEQQGKLYRIERL